MANAADLAPPHRPPRRCPRATHSSANRLPSRRDGRGADPVAPSATAPAEGVHGSTGGGGPAVSGPAPRARLTRRARRLVGRSELLESALTPSVEVARGQPEARRRAGGPPSVLPAPSGPMRGDGRRPRCARSSGRAVLRRRGGHRLVEDVLDQLQPLRFHGGCLSPRSACAPRSGRGVPSRAASRAATMRSAERGCAPFGDLDGGRSAVEGPRPDRPRGARPPPGPPWPWRRARLVLDAGPEAEGGDEDRRLAQVGAHVLAPPRSTVTPSARSPATASAAFGLRPTIERSRTGRSRRTRGMTCSTRKRAASSLGA